MLSGATASAFAMAGTAVFRIVVSSDSMKNATATSQGNSRFTELPGAAGGTETALESAGIILPPADYVVAPHFQFGIADSSSAAMLFMQMAKATSGLIRNRQ